jgi:cobalt/nickel transport system permease protein
MTDVPQWLAQPENYSPPTDSDRFIDKSILSFIGLISKIKQQSGRSRDLLWVSPGFKLLFTLLYVVLVSSSRHFTFVYLMLAYIVVVLAMLPAGDIRKSLKGAVIAAVFTYVILLPAALHGSRYSVTMIPAKVFACVLSVNILSYSTRWDHIISSLKRFFFPDLFIFVFDITIKYIVMLGEFALQMLYALKLRSVGKNRSKYGSIGGVGGMLFIKSRDMSEEMYYAMECRGFTGEYRAVGKFHFTVYDGAYILLNAGFVWLFVYFQNLV